MFDGKRSRIEPKISWLTVNRVCNLRCRWCYAEATDYHPEEMSFELAKSLTRITKEIGVPAILLIGGEPTLWKHIFRFNHFCKEIGIRSVLVTNGLQFGKDGFWKKYQEIPNDNIGLSLKAWNPGHLKEVAQSTAFKQMKRGMKRACARFNSQIGITYNSFYCGNLPKMVQFAMDCGAKAVQINFCYTTFADRKPRSDYMVPPKELAKNIVRDYPQLMQITDGKIAFEMMLPFCLFPYEFIQELKERDQIISVCQLKKGKGLVWNENGDVLMCNALFGFPIGHYETDFTNVESLKKWLNSKTILGYYNKMGAYPSDLCQSCAMYQDCGGGCPLRWAIYNPEDICKPFKENSNGRNGQISRDGRLDCTIESHRNTQ